MNCFLAITCLLAVTASTKADGGVGLEGLVYAPGHASADYYAYPRYAFEYAVKDPHTGDNKAQWEKRDGDVVKGAYSLVEPDGSLRVVEYWADDKSGFNAVVKRVGPNLHPVVAPAPIYKAPIPVLESHGPIAPISVGPIAKYHGLASAPLISGPVGPVLGGHAISSAAVYKPASVPIIKAPVAPILSAPILPAPIAHAPIAPVPIGHGPILAPAPIYKSAPVLAPLPGPILSAPYGLSSLGGWGGLYKGGLGAGYLDDLGHGLLNKAGPILPPLDLGYGPVLGYKH
ncbi:cuticle protein-like [Ostrinia nubilalis]|uniref:cuticle protein-like n=1 Tax=Ostrinia nubilalis TaxID=29057 RepID=UPI0030823AE6